MEKKSNLSDLIPPNHKKSNREIIIGFIGIGLIFSGIVLACNGTLLQVLVLIIDWIASVFN